VAIPVQEYVAWFYVSVHNSTLVQKIDSQNNLCRVESWQVLMESLKPGQEEMQSVAKYLIS